MRKRERVPGKLMKRPSQVHKGPVIPDRKK